MLKYNYQFMIIQNYTKDTEELFIRIIRKISALTTLQHISHMNGKPVVRIKLAHI